MRAACVTLCVVAAAAALPAAASFDAWSGVWHVVATDCDGTTVVNGTKVNITAPSESEALYGGTTEDGAMSVTLEPDDSGKFAWRFQLLNGDGGELRGGCASGFAPEVGLVACAGAESSLLVTNDTAVFFAPNRAFAASDANAKKANAACEGARVHLRRDVPPASQWMQHAALLIFMVGFFAMRIYNSYRRTAKQYEAVGAAKAK